MCCSFLLYHMQLMNSTKKTAVSFSETVTANSIDDSSLFTDLFLRQTSTSTYQILVLGKTGWCVLRLLHTHTHTQTLSLVSFSSPLLSILTFQFPSLLKGEPNANRVVNVELRHRFFNDVAVRITLQSDAAGVISLGDLNK